MIIEKCKKKEWTQKMLKSLLLIALEIEQKIYNKDFC